jgi:hypothetical protein
MDLSNRPRHPPVRRSMRPSPSWCVPEHRRPTSLARSARHAGRSRPTPAISVIVRPRRNRRPDRARRRRRCPQRRPARSIALSRRRRPMCPEHREAAFGSMPLAATVVGHSWHTRCPPMPSPSAIVGPRRERRTSGELGYRRSHNSPGCSDGLPHARVSPTGVRRTCRRVVRRRAGQCRSRGR